MLLKLRFSSPSANCKHNCEAGMQNMPSHIKSSKQALRNRHVLGGSGKGRINIGATRNDSLRKRPWLWNKMYMIENWMCEPICYRYFQRYQYFLHVGQVSCFTKRTNKLGIQKHFIVNYIWQNYARPNLNVICSYTMFELNV